MIIDFTIGTIRESVKYSELIAAITGTIYFYKYKHTHLKYFLFLLWYITITEFVASFASKQNVLVFFDENGVDYNYWFYNLLRIVTFTTLLLIYVKSISNQTYRRILKACLIIYILAVIINWSFIQNFAFEISEVPKILGSMFLIFAIIFYLIELLRSDKILVFHKMLLFWISVGLLLFYSGTIPFALNINGYALIPGIHKLFLIVYILAIMMYLIFTFGFIWSKKEQQ